MYRALASHPGTELSMRSDVADSYKLLMGRLA